MHIVTAAFSLTARVRHCSHQTSARLRKKKTNTPILTYELFIISIALENLFFC